MATTKNTENETSWTEELITIFKDLDFNMFYKYLTNCTNEIIQEILIKLDQMMAKDPNTKKYLGPIKMEILNFVGKNKNIWNPTNRSTNQQKETSIVYSKILNILTELMQTKKQEQEQEQEQKNNSNQKIQP